MWGKRKTVLGHRARAPRPTRAAAAALAVVLSLVYLAGWGMTLLL